MSFDDALHTYILESRELLTQMEDALLRIEQQQADPELINEIFRAAHTIKGSAGLFGLDYIVSFTHVAESLLDSIRAGELGVDQGTTALLLEAGDYISTLIDCAEQGTEPDDASTQQGTQLMARLSALLGREGSGSDEVSVAIPVGMNGKIEREDADVVGTDNWHISLRFGLDVFRNGMDPLSFIRYLATLGQIVHIVTLTDAIPRLSALDPESCHLGFEIAFRTDVDKAAIENVFDFVRDDCAIRILPPRSKISEYLTLIAHLNDDSLRLGDILVRCGTLTESELKQALKIQSADTGILRPIGEVLIGEQMTQERVVVAALEKQKQIKETKSGEASLIRVDSDKLDQLINLVGELIIAGAGATLAAQRSGEQRLIEATAIMASMMEEVRDSALSLRMVQIGGTFNRFHRVVRDVSKELGKDIRLVINGADTELDKTIIEKIGDPLTHLVRNSMDHGIEPVEVRVARGKPVQGTLKLNAYHDSGSVVIEVADDGGGLNRDKILAKAIERGLVGADQSMTDREIYNLIFEAGFSTAEVISNLSGRGVGMDVVRSNIQALRGTIEIDSIAGQGTTMRIHLPLTLAIIDGFLIRVGNAAYVVPLDMVIECIELPDANDAEGNYINLRGELLPYLRLRDLFEITGTVPRRENIVVVRFAGCKAGLVVDELMGEFHTVIKPLGKMFGSVRGFGGFTIMGSGEIALVLDVERLMQQVIDGVVFKV